LCNIKTNPPKREKEKKNASELNPWVSVYERKHCPAISIKNPSFPPRKKM
jgi:hypothetical protein